jgi:hypothetical protein
VLRDKKVVGVFVRFSVAPLQFQHRSFQSLLSLSKETSDIPTRYNIASIVLPMTPDASDTQKNGTSLHR